MTLKILQITNFVKCLLALCYKEITRTLPQISKEFVLVTEKTMGSDSYMWYMYVVGEQIEIKSGSAA